jgi:hypothetical protein
MKWAVYARNGFEGADAFGHGLLENGHSVRILSVSDYRQGQTEDFDAVAVFGLQWHGMDVLHDYKSKDIPVFVIDYGYCKRTNHAHDWRTGHWQLSLGGLNKIPDGDFGSSRWDALGIEIKEHGGDSDGYTLLCVQTTGDASHGMNESELQQWAYAQNRKYQNLLIRPHPLQEHLNYGLPVCPAKTMQEALSRARLVVTGNSNSGHDALLNGVPVVATIPGAAWEPLSGETLPSMELRTSHFHRLAWGQWTWAEFRTGEPQAFAIQHCVKQ